MNTTKFARFSLFLPAMLGLFLLLGCSEDDNGKGDTFGEYPYGTISLYLKDTPFHSLVSLSLEFEKVIFTSGSSETIEYVLDDTTGTDANNNTTYPADPVVFDLDAIIRKSVNGNLNHTNDLKFYNLPIVNIVSITLVPRTANAVNEADTGAGVVTISYPDTTLVIDTAITIKDNVHDEYLVDFDFYRGLVDNGSGFDLRNTAKVIKTHSNSTVSSVDVSGTVTICAGAFPGAVYFYQGNVTADDMDTVAGSVEPYLTTIVDSANNYDIGYLPPGDYTVAATCDLDDPDVDEALTFTPEQTVSLPNGGDSTVIDFN